MAKFCTRGWYCLVVALLLPMVLSCRHVAQDSFDQGVAAIEQADYDLAIACFTEMIRLDSKWEDAYFCRGGAYLLKGEFDKAVADFTATFRLDPTYAPAYFNRDLAYEEEGEQAKAEADFAKAKELGYVGIIGLRARP